MVAINGLNFTFGADPEMFISKKGKPVSAYGLIPGTKAAPHKVENGAVQIDGMALEFNIDPCENKEQFKRNLNLVMKQILAMVPGYDVHTSCVANFGKAYIDKQPKEAVELGCSPDYNAYTMAANPRPQGDNPFRSAAGHIHIGWTNGVDPHDPGHFAACARLTRQLDRYLGVPSILMDQGEAAQKRRKLYGAAGAFRPTHFGVEYRVLSNFWLLNDEKFPHWKDFIFGNTVAAIKKTFEDPKSSDAPVGWKQAKDLINNGDVNEAQEAIENQEEILMPRAYK